MLLLKVYPGQDGSFTLYEDEGDTYHYENGAYSMIEMSWDDTNRRLTIGPRIGSFPGMPEHRQFMVEIAGRAGQIVVSYQGTPVVVQSTEFKVQGRDEVL
jgi:alpha-D-xyloside xylohydrolase